MTWCIDNLLCKFYIQLLWVCNSTDILCILLWLSPHSWDAPVSGYMEVNKWMNEHKKNAFAKGEYGIILINYFGLY